MHFILSSAICFNFDRSKILSSGNGLGILKHREKGTGISKHRVLFSPNFTMLLGKYIVRTTAKKKKKNSWKLGIGPLVSPI